MVYGESAEERKERLDRELREKESEKKFILSCAKLGVYSLFILIAVSYGCSTFVTPIITVYQERKHGEAELARADSNRQIRVLEAVAEKESSKALAEAEIIRARGVAEANEIIGGSLTNNESYLRYLWIQGLQNNKGQTVYIPTEAGLPILEANPEFRKK